MCHRWPIQVCGGKEGKQKQHSVMDIFGVVCGVWCAFELLDIFGGEESTSVFDTTSVEQHRKSVFETRATTIIVLVRVLTPTHRPTITHSHTHTHAAAFNQHTFQRFIKCIDQQQMSLHIVHITLVAQSAIRTIQTIYAKSNCIELGLQIAINEFG